MQKKKGVQHLAVSQEEHGRKLLAFLEARLQNKLPRSLFMRLVRSGQIRLDGCRCKPFARVAVGQIVRVPPLTLEGTRSESAGGLCRVAETEDFVVLHKPVGLAVHTGTGCTDSIQTRLNRLYAESSFVPTPVHRLDKATSGLLVCGKTHTFVRQMHTAWQDVHKGYLCRVQGVWQTPGWTEISLPLEKKHGPQGERVYAGTGKAARTFVYAVKDDGVSTLMLAVLGTGRTHQIRVHLAATGFPLLGDGKYGIPGERLFLHAAFVHWGEQTFSVFPEWLPLADSCAVREQCLTALSLLHWKNYVSF